MCNYIDREINYGNCCKYSFIIIIMIMATLFIIIIIIVRDDTGSRFVVREGKVKTTKLWPRDNNKYC